MDTVKERVFSPISDYLNSLPKEILEDKDFSVLCLISDESGVGEIMVGKGETLVSGLAHALLDNDDLMTIVKTAVSVVERYKRDNDKYTKMAEMADKKYKS